MCNKSSLIQHPDIITRKIRGLNYVLDCESSSIIKFNDVGSLIWDLFKQENTIESVVNYISNEFDVDSNSIDQDVTDFMTKYSTLFLNPDRLGLYHPKRVRMNEDIYTQLKQLGFKYNVPTMVEIEVTKNCSLNCIHCSVTPDYNSELSTDEFYNIIDQLQDAGCFEITFTGGEIFTRSDAIHIIKYANSKKFAIRLLTSATTITKKQIESISSLLMVASIQISIYSAIPEVHDRITRVNGSFEKSINNAKIMLLNNLQVTLACVIMNINLGSYATVKNLAAMIGAEYIVEYPVRARDNGSRDTFDFRIEEEGLLSIIRDNKNVFCQKIDRCLEDNICHAGTTVCAISSKGDVYPCIIFPSLAKVGSLKEKLFTEIWENSSELIYLRNLKLKDTYECKDCVDMEYCRICPGLSLLEDGDMLSCAKINRIMAKCNHMVFNEEEAIRSEEKRFPPQP